MLKGKMLKLAELFQTRAAEFQTAAVTLYGARPDRFHDVTVRWLAHHGLTYDRLLLTEDKLRACTEAGVQVMIDDGPHYAEQFAAAGKPVIVFEQPYNREIAHDVVYRAADWLEVKQQLERIDAGMFGKGIIS